jgi:hypothetical protein
MKIRVILLFLSVILVVSCKKNKSNPVPNIPFDISIDINLPSYNALISVGSWAYVSGGSRGIIVYRRSIDQFVAFDRHSPADPEGVCAHPLYPDKVNYLTLIDSCSSARFSMYDGSPITGCEFGLRQYQTSFDGLHLVRIYN